jgi:hypothetical protein
LGLADRSEIDWPSQAAVTTPPLLAKVADGGEVVEVVVGGGTVVVVVGSAGVIGAVSVEVRGDDTVVVPLRGAVPPEAPVDDVTVRASGWPVGSENGWGGAVEVVEPGPADRAVVVSDKRGAGNTGRRPAATDSLLVSGGPVEDAVTLAIPEDTPNHATAVAVAVPSAQVAIASDRRTQRVCTAPSGGRAKDGLSLPVGETFAGPLALA